MGKAAAWALAAVFVIAAARRADAQLVVEAYMGTVATARTSLDLRQPASGTDIVMGGVDYKSESFHAPPYYGIGVAYFLRAPAWLGIGAEMVHMKVYAQVSQVVNVTGTLDGAPVAESLPMNSLVQRFSLSHGQNLILFDAVARHALGASGDVRSARVIVLGRFGAGPTLPHVESTVRGVSDERYEWGAWALQAAAGIEVRLAGGLHALAEYKFTRCRQSVAAADGVSIETPLNSHHVVFGASYHF